MGRHDFTYDGSIFKRMSEQVNEEDYDESVVHATHDFHSVQKSELTLIKGSAYYLLNPDDDNDQWIQVLDKNSGESGMAPKCYLVNGKNPKRFPYYLNGVLMKEAIELMDIGDKDFAYLMIKGREKGEFSLVVKSNNNIKKFDFKYLSQYNEYICNFSKVKVICKEPKEFISSILGENFANKYLERVEPKLPGIGRYVDPNVAISDIKDQIYINEGMFGTVYKALGLFGNDLAIKYFSGSEDLSEPIQNETMLKLQRLQKLYHRNILPIVASENNAGRIAVIMPFCQEGSLIQYLRLHKEDILDSPDGPEYEKSTLNFYLRDVCAGMKYLHMKKIIHCDLACRNIMLDSNMNCQVSDFYHSYILDDEKGAINYRSGAKLRLKSLAPEVIERRIMTQAFDVWQFGLLAIEIYTFGAELYPEFDARSQEFLNLIMDGMVPKRPDFMSEELYGLLVNYCWPKDHNSRSTFKILKSMIV